VIYGYARVSRQDSNLALQLYALEQHGAEEIFQEKASGAGICREQLEAVLGRLRPGDTLVVWKLDRLSRTMKQLLELMEDFGRRRIDFVSLTESFDTITAAGRMCRRYLLRGGADETGSRPRAHLGGACDGKGARARRWKARQIPGDRGHGDPHV